MKWNYTKVEIIEKIESIPENKLKIFIICLALSFLDILLGSVTILLLLYYLPPAVHGPVASLNDFQLFLLIIYTGLQLLYLIIKTIIYTLLLITIGKGIYRIFKDFIESDVKKGSDLYRIKIINTLISINKYIILMVIVFFLLDILGYIVDYSTYSDLYYYHELPNLLTANDIWNIAQIPLFVFAHFYLILKLEIEVLKNKKEAKIFISAS